MSRSSRRPQPGTETGRSFWLVMAAAFAVAGVLRFGYFYLDDLMRGERNTLVERLINESTGAAMALLVMVPLVAVWQRWPLERERWRRLVPIYAIALVATGLAHTTLMWGSRVLLYPVIEGGTYGYGPMPWPYFMELPNQLIMFAATLGVLTAVRHSRLLREREQRATALQRDLARAQLATMRLQLQPHFLFNALNTISATMYDDPGTADEMIEQLGALLRRSLQRDQMDEVALRDELAMLEQYVAIMRARFGDAVRVTITHPPEVEVCAVPSLLLQPLVENAFRHGNASRIGVASIEVRIRIEGARLVIEVLDDGPGVPDDVQPSRAGLGLSLTADRLRLLYGDAQLMSVGNAAEGGFRVTIAIPLRSAELRPAPAVEPTAHAYPARR
jgi:signal transduction histidine kinase